MMQPSVEGETVPQQRTGALPQLVCEVGDKRFGKLGYLVIDRGLRGGAIGGIRFAPGLTLDEVAGLARSMTLKCGLLRVPLGGAKAGIVTPPDLEPGRRNELLAAFGRGLRPLLQSEQYIPGEDLGVSAADLNVIRRAAGLPAVTPSVDGAYFTARTVATAVVEALRSRGRPLAGATVVIEGLGKVGSHLASILARQGARLVAVSTSEGAVYDPAGLDVMALLARRQLYSDRCVLDAGLRSIPLADLLLLDVDVLVPCARPWSVTAENAGSLGAALVVPGANIAVTAEAEALLFARGVLCLPDFLVNCGGLLSASLAAQGFSTPEIDAVIALDFGRKVEHVLAEAQRRAAMPGVVAQEWALRRFEELAAEEGRPAGHAARLARLGHKGPRAVVERGANVLLRRGMLPFERLRPLALAHARRAMI